MNNSRQELAVSESSFNFKTNTSRRYFYGVIVVAIVVIIGLAIALAVVVVNQQNEENSHGSSSVEPKLCKSTVPHCFQHTGSTNKNLDIANCVLESYPLIDG